MDCDELVISLLFPPSDYVSGINAFKRILNNKKPVDILQAKSEIANTNFDVFNRYINDRLFLDVIWSLTLHQAFSNHFPMPERCFKRIMQKFIHDPGWQTIISSPLTINSQNRMFTGVRNFQTL